MEIEKDEQVARPYVRLLYDSVLSLIDRDLKRLLLLLSDEEFKKNTVVVFYSDHGEEFGERGRCGHPANSLYNEVIKTPLVIYFPGVTAQKLDMVTQNIDIFPTLFSLLGLRPPGDLQGASLLPVIMGVVKQTNPISISQSGSNRFSVYDGVWKLMISKTATSLNGASLYNLREDPQENTNLISSLPWVGRFFFKELIKKISTP